MSAEGFVIIPPWIIAIALLRIFALMAVLGRSYLDRE